MGCFSLHLKFQSFSHSVISFFAVAALNLDCCVIFPFPLLFVPSCSLKMIMLTPSDTGNLNKSLHQDNKAEATQEEPGSTCMMLVHTAGKCHQNLLFFYFLLLFICLYATHIWAFLAEFPNSNLFTPQKSDQCLFHVKLIWICI